MRRILCQLSEIVLSALILAPTAQAADKLTVILEWFVNPDHAPLVIAREKGFFADAGLDVDLVAPADPNDPPKLVAAGKFDIGVSYQPQLHMQVDEGLPVVRVGTLVATPLVALMVSPDGPVKTLADLKGKRIGYSVGFYRDTLLPAMLARHGLKLADVETVAINFALSQALLSGQVAATIGAFRNFEINQMELAGEPGRAIFPEDEGVPPYDELIFIATRPRSAKSACAPSSTAWSGASISDQPPGRQLEAVRQGLPRAGRRTQQAGLARYPAPFRAAAGRPRFEAL